MTPNVSGSLRKRRRILDPQEVPLDPDDLTRRLNKIIAEEETKELKALERKRSNWEAELLEVRREQQDCVRGRIMSAPSFEPTYAKRESISLAPDQVLPLAPVYNDPSPQPEPEPTRKTSMPFVPPLWAAPTTPRRPSTVEMNLMRMRRESMLDLETIDELCRGGGKENSDPEWSLGERPRKRSSALRPVEEVGAPNLNIEAHSTDALVFHSGESTLVNSWRNSFRSSVGSRKRSSILKRVESYWIVKPHYGDEKDHNETAISPVDLSPVSRKPSFGFFSKLKI